MKLLFWSSLSLIFFAYAGYPIVLYLRARFWSRPILRASIFPSITVILAVHNEENNLPRKLQNLAELDYPTDRYEVIAVSDGSTDATNKILTDWAKGSRQTIILPEHCGKAAALNHAIARSHGEIIVFTDARQKIASDAVKNLVVNFADRSVGCVSGDISIGDPAGANVSMNGLGIYWRLETNMRRWEGATGSLIGAAGCLYAVRKNLVVPFPAETILDDVYLPLHIARQGKLVVFESEARGWDSPQHNRRREFRRKVRTIAGNYQLLRLAPWLLTTKNPVRLEFVCHKMLRLVAPFAFASLLVSSFFVQGLIYRGACALQVCGYALALLAVIRPRLGVVSRMADISLAFLVLNGAAVVALFYFVTGKKAAWAT